MTTTTIEWATDVWNPLLGCDRASAGCDHCYAITSAHIRASNPHPKVSAAFAGLTHRDGGRLDWTGQINLLPDRLSQPLRWRKPRRVFVNSMSDLFHKDVPDEYIAKVFAVMAATPQHTYQILTKRHGRMRSLLRDECRCGGGHAPSIHFRSAMAWAASKANPDRIPGLPDDAEHHVYFEAGWPLPNVWLGVSVENQQWADTRIPALLATPAAVRWISAEPLLGPVELRKSWVGADPFLPDERGLDWVVVGGESGHGSRPMHPDWARNLRDQCTAAALPFFFKQWGDWIPNPSLLEQETTRYTDVADDIRMWRVGKKAAGRELDGRTWDEMPTAVTA